MPNVREVLEPLYNAAVFEVEFPGRSFIFDAGTTDVPCDQFFGITAFNPGLDRPGPEENERRNHELEGDLAALGATVLPAVGRNRAGTHAEPSFAVFRVSLPAVLTLARKFGQAAVFHWDGERFNVLWCD